MVVALVHVLFAAPELVVSAIVSRITALSSLLTQVGTWTDTVSHEGLVAQGPDRTLPARQRGLSGQRGTERDQHAGQRDEVK
jgi:hypothetical protein